MNKDNMAKHIDRVAVIKQLQKGHITQLVAAMQLSLSVRQIRKICKKYKDGGAVVLLHQNLGKQNSRKISVEEENRAMDWIRQKGVDFGPTFTQEKLSEYLAINVSVGTVRTWMIRNNLLKTRRKPHRQQFKRRQRKAFFGLMVQVDGSDHNWFENRGDKCVLLTCIDDATGVIIARFATGETTKDLMMLFKNYIETHGRPHSVYSDHGGPYKVNFGNSDGNKKTQLGRALKELGIEQIFANSPQAKGRIERNHATHQDRLVKELRLRGISTIDAANQYLTEEYIPAFNKKFTVKPTNALDAHRSRRAFNLYHIFSVQEERVMQNDGIVQYNNMLFQITKNRIYVKSNTKVVIREHLDEQLTLWKDNVQLEYEHITVKPIAPKEKIFKPKKVHPASRMWNNGISSSLTGKRR